MTKLDRVKGLLHEPLAAKGYEILQLRYLKSGRPKLEILIERLDEQPVTIEDCTQASRLISAVLDVEDPIPDSYLLEVSSPGLDRPLLRIRDYERFKGQAVKVELHDICEGRKRFKGSIQEVKEDQITFDVEDVSSENSQRITVRLPEICHCKLLPVL